MVLKVFDDLRDGIEEALAPLSNPIERLVAGAQAYVSFGLENPGRYSILFAHAREWPGFEPPTQFPFEALPPVGGEGFALLVDSIRECVAAGVSTSTDVFADATAVWVALHGTVSLWSTLCQGPWPNGPDFVRRLAGRAGADPTRSRLLSRLPRPASDIGSVPMDPVVEDLSTQHEQLRGILDDLDEEQWGKPTRCEGWDVADVVVHLAQTDEMAIGSAQGRYAEVFSRLTEGLSAASSIDDGVAAMVARERDFPPSELRERWSEAAAELIRVLDGMDLSTRVMWVTGELSARTMATTRLSETWIHTGDIAGALDIELEPSRGIRQIARLAWRTLPYTFTSAGRTMTGPVAFRLKSPAGEAWDFLPDEPALTTISGPAVNLCDVASRRKDASATSLRGEGPDASDVLSLVRTYA